MSRKTQGNAIAIGLVVTMLLQSGIMSAQAETSVTSVNNTSSISTTNAVDATSSASSSLSSASSFQSSSAPGTNDGTLTETCSANNDDTPRISIDDVTNPIDQLLPGTINGSPADNDDADVRLNDETVTPDEQEVLAPSIETDGVDLHAVGSIHVSMQGAIGSQFTLSTNFSGVRFFDCVPSSADVVIRSGDGEVSSVFGDIQSSAPQNFVCQMIVYGSAAADDVVAIEATATITSPATTVACAANADDGKKTVEDVKQYFANKPVLTTDASKIMDPKDYIFKMHTKIQAIPIAKQTTPLATFQAAKVRIQPNGTIVAETILYPVRPDNTAAINLQIDAVTQGVQKDNTIQQCVLGKVTYAWTENTNGVSTNKRREFGPFGLKKADIQYIQVIRIPKVDHDLYKEQKPKQAKMIDEYLALITGHEYLHANYNELYVGEIKKYLTGGEYEDDINTMMLTSLRNYNKEKGTFDLPTSKNCSAAVIEQASKAFMNKLGLDKQGKDAYRPGTNTLLPRLSDVPTLWGRLTWRQQNMHLQVGYACLYFSESDPAADDPVITGGCSVDNARPNSSPWVVADTLVGPLGTTVPAVGETQKFNDNRIVYTRTK